MADKKIMIDTDNFKLPENDDDALAWMENFVTVLEANREKFSFISDEELEDLKIKRDNMRNSIDACKIADAEVERTGAEERKSRAAYELELQRYHAKQAQAGVSKALQAKKPRFQD